MRRQPKACANSKKKTAIGCAWCGITAEFYKRYTNQPTNPSRGKTMRLTNEEYYQVAKLIESMAVDGEINAWPKDIARKLSSKHGFKVSPEQARKAAGMANVTIWQKPAIGVSNKQRPANYEVLIEIHKVQTRIESMLLKIMAELGIKLTNQSNNNGENQ